MTVKEFVVNELGEQITYNLVRIDQLGAFRDDVEPFEEMYKTQLKNSEYADLTLIYFEVLTKKRVKLIVQ